MASKRQVIAVAIASMVVAGLSVAESAAWAQTSPAQGSNQAQPTVSLADQIASAAAAAQADPSFASKTPAQKTAAIKAAVAAVLASGSYTTAEIQSALVSAVSNGQLSAVMAVSVSARMMWTSTGEVWPNRQHRRMA